MIPRRCTGFRGCGPAPEPEPADRTTPDIHTTPIAVAPEPARRSRPNVALILLILVLALGIPVMLTARALRVGRHARREGAFLTLLDADEISVRGTATMNEIFTRMDSAVSPEASMTAVFFDDRRTGMMTLTVTGLTDGAVTVHKLPAGSARTIVRHFCGAFPPTLPWQAYLLCLPRRGAVVRHLMLDASEAKALGISAVDPADTAAMTKLHHLPL